MNFAIVGCGFIGQKRAASLAPRGHMVIAADVDIARAESLAQAHGARACDNYSEAVTHPQVEAVIVATTHDQLVPVAVAAAEAGKHILLEKPGARTPRELAVLGDAAKKYGVHVHVGFNHRFHPAMQKAKELIVAGALGPLYFIRGRYGHGGRIGYDKEWRADPAVSGGGELLDQGAHLIDLSQWYFDAGFSRVSGDIATYFWDMPVEDNAFLTLATDSGQIAQLHVTWTEWKNMFSLEITGRDAKLHIEGLGGSYGTERLTVHTMKPEMGPPDTTVYDYPGADNSWHDELAHFLHRIESGRTTGPDIASTNHVLTVVEKIYRDNGAAWVTKGNTQ